jgi:hypothetical protein
MEQAGKLTSKYFSKDDGILLLYSYLFSIFPGSIAKQLIAI